jgi:hypothetical protein
MRISKFLPLAIVMGAVVLIPSLGFCSVESTLTAVQSKLINVILPLAGILGLCFAAFSFFTGNPGARQHLWLAIIGACVGFGAPSIIAFIRGLVN